ncbi:MAG: hypothetical protein R3B48_09580 [Kofleriaceae bacterium]
MILVCALTAAACADPGPLKVRYKLTEGATQKCPATCASVGVACKSVLSIRIIDPARPDQALASVCDVLEGSHSLCEMSRVRLPADVRLPAQRLAVQVALYNAEDVAAPGGGYTCPSDLPFDANNFAAPSEYQPAVAGMGYFDPGDTETVVELGCADLTVVNTPACRGDDQVRITASADDFDTGVFLSEPDKVTLWVGEPTARVNSSSQTEYVMSNPRMMDKVSGTPAAWSVDVPARFMESACVDVLEDRTGSTRAISCKRVAANEPTIDLRGIRLTRTTLAAVLSAIDETTSPDQGLVIGMVLDQLGKPAAGVTVRPSSGTVEYLGPEKDKVLGNATSASGMFLSRDAPFATSWAAVGTSGAYGGLVVDRVTIVILQPDASL